MLYGAQTPRRRDAQRNRSAIVRAAGEVMTSPRPAVAMPEIARRAGVGLATVYRHFPDRHALAVAVVTDRITVLETCVAENAHRPAAFRRILDEILRCQVRMRPLALLARGLDPHARGRLERRILTVLAGPLRRAQEHGHVRRDLVPGDLALLFAIVEGVVDGASGGAAGASGGAAAERAIELALDGVCRPDP